MRLAELYKKVAHAKNPIKSYYVSYELLIGSMLHSELCPERDEKPVSFLEASSIAQMISEHIPNAYNILLYELDDDGNLQLTIRDHKNILKKR